MTKFMRKPVAVEALTFDELVQHGIDHGANIINGMPWSFLYNGVPVTHENDECYIVGMTSLEMTPKRMLVHHEFGVSVYTLEEFAEQYEAVDG